MKLLLLSLLSVVSMMAQNGPFEFEVSPRTFNMNFDRNNGALSANQKVSIKNVTNLGAIFRISTAFGEYVKVDRNVGYLFPNESTEVNFLVSAFNLGVGNYTLSSSISSANNVLSVPITFNLNVFDTTPTPSRFSSAIHIASGLGWKSRIDLYNPTTNVARIRLDVKDQRGLVSTSTNIGVSSQFVVEVPANASRYIEFSEPNKTDTLFLNVELFTLNGIQVSGTTTYVNLQNQEAAIPLQSIANSSDRVIAYDDLGLFTTGLVYKNESDFWNTFTFEVFDELGQQVDLKLFIFEPRSQRALSLKTLLNTNGRRGLIKVRAQFPFNVFALRFNQSNNAFLPFLSF